MKMIITQSLNIIQIRNFGFPGNFKCPTGFSILGVYCFYVDYSNSDFSSKISSCAAIGGHLAKIDSSEENAAVIDFLQGW